MIIFLNFIGIGLILFIIWWFWLSNAKAIKASKDIVQITVKDGVYTPARIEISTKQEITLEFIRYDAIGCSDTVIFPSLDKQVSLPVNQPRKIQLGRLTPGPYPFACPMKMYAGELIVTPEKSIGGDRA